MKVIKHIKDTDCKEFVQYPTKMGNLVVGLDANIEYYEIVEFDKPICNLEQFNIKQTIELTEIKGQYNLNIANVKYLKEEKSKNVIINYINTNLGEFLDREYPHFLRIKHLKEATIFEIRIGTEENISEEEQNRYDYINSLDSWITECRQQREDFERTFLDTGILLDLIYSPKPIQ